MKNLVTVFKTVLIPLFFFTTSNAQVSFSTDQSKDIIIDNCDTSKIVLIIFRDPLHQNSSLDSLLNIINTKSQASIYNIFMEYIEGCSAPKAFSLCSNRNISPYFKYQPALVFFSTRNNIWPQFLAYLEETGRSAYLNAVTDNNSKKADFVSAPYHYSLPLLISYLDMQSNLEKNHNLIVEDTTSFVHLNNVASNSNPVLRRRLNLSYSGGTFQQQVVMSGSARSSYKQSSEKFPLFHSFGINIREQKTDKKYLLYGLQFKYGFTRIKSNLLDRFDYRMTAETAGFNINPYLSYASSSYVAAGLSGGIGFKLVDLKGKPLFFESSVHLSKILTGKSTGVIHLFSAEKTAIVNNESTYKDNFNFQVSLKPYTRFNFNETEINLGMSFGASLFSIKSESNYNLISDNTYNALERSSAFLYNYHLGVYLSIILPYGLTLL